MKGQQIKTIPSVELQSIQLDDRPDFNNQISNKPNKY